MKRINFLLISFIFLIATSCIKFGDADAVVLYYHISNHSNYRIKVEFYDFWSHKYYSSVTSDSIVYFDAGENRDLLVVYNVTNYGKNEPEHYDTLQGIHVLKIFKNETIPTQKDYRLRKYWTYSQPDTYKYEYDLEITNESFIP